MCGSLVVLILVVKYFFAVNSMFYAFFGVFFFLLNLACEKELSFSLFEWKLSFSSKQMYITLTILHSLSVLLYLNLEDINNTIKLKYGPRSVAYNK